MEYFKQILEFLLAVVNNWAGYTTGGVIVAAVWLWLTLKQKSITRKWGMILTGLFLFLAVFTAWREQYLKTHPGIIMEMDEVIVADNIPHSAALIMVTASVANRSDPTILDSWVLEISVPGEPRTIEQTPVYLDPRATIRFAGMSGIPDFKMDAGDVLYNKTLPQPLPLGSKVTGILEFEIKGSSKDRISKKGTVFTLRCKNVSRDVIKASQYWTGNSNGHQYYPGMKPEPE